MARKKENLLEDLIKLPWWVGVSGAVLFFTVSIIIKQFQIGMFHFENAASVCLRMFAIVFALGGVLSFIGALFKGRLLNKTEKLTDIKSLSWQEFESLVGEYYRRKGYSVSEIGGNSPDGGIDLLAKKNGEKLVIQCKHWKAFKVDVKIARELYGVMVDATGSGAVLITSGDFTQPTIDFVKDKPIELIDGPKLVKLIAEAKAITQKASLPAKSRAVLIPTEPPPLKKDENNRAYMPPSMRAELDAREKSEIFTDNNPVCPTCKTHMVLRTAQRGPTPGAKFWGCTNYPKCRQIISLEANKV
jgi:restriction system protein